MEKKYTLTLDKEFTQYCELNNITDIQKQAKETFSRGFALLKYGEVPQGNRIKEIVEIEKEVEVIKEVERIVEIPIEVIKEVIKEVPIEKIVEVQVPVEVVKEVTVEKQGKTKTIVKEVIKEVPVEKIVEVVKEVVNMDEINRLTEENKKLKSDLDKITTSINNMSRGGRFIKNSNLGSLYDE
jgi:hypothetical protein